eukprot:COSAG01_NODE_3046_length_6672_cov_4.249962_7_plen_206_part_00
MTPQPCPRFGRRRWALARGAAQPNVDVAVVLSRRRGRQLPATTTSVISSCRGVRRRASWSGAAWRGAPRRSSRAPGGRSCRAPRPWSARWVRAGAGPLPSPLSSPLLPSPPPPRSSLPSLLFSPLPSADCSGSVRGGGFIWGLCPGGAGYLPFCVAALVQQNPARHSCRGVLEVLAGAECWRCGRGGSRGAPGGAAPQGRPAAGP